MLKIHREADNLLPVKDLPCFYAFLSGLDLRLTFFKLAKPGECLPSTEFVRWVNSRLRIPGEFNVFSLLQLRYGAEHIAYESFFSLLEEFVSGTHAIDLAIPPQVAEASVPIVIDRTELIRKMQQRPELFLGRRSLTLFMSFLRGDSYAVEYLGVRTVETPKIGSIDAKIKIRLGYPSECDVRQMLLHDSGFDEAGAFEKYCRYLVSGE